MLIKELKDLCKSCFICSASFFFLACEGDRALRGIALLMVSVHEAEERVEEAVALGWLRCLGLQPYRLRVSGHYYPHEFARLVGLVKPREIVPAHTEEPGFMLRLFEKLAYKE